MGKYDFLNDDVLNKNIVTDGADTNTTQKTQKKPTKDLSFLDDDPLNKNVIEEGSANDKPYESKYYVGVTGRPERTVMGTLGDAAVTAGHAGVNLLASGYGLTNLLSYGTPKRFWNALGLDPNSEEAHAFLNKYYSDATKQVMTDVNQSTGAMGRLEAIGRNPSYLAIKAAENLPMAYVGGALATPLKAAGVPAALAIGGAEGAMQTGSAIEQNLAREGKLTLRGTATAVGSGLSTAFFGAISSSVARKMGVPDVDDLFSKLKTTRKDVTKRILSSGFTEGVLEELPQSVTEQIWMNAALGKEGWELLEGVPESAVEGTLLGSVMGGYAGMGIGRGNTIEDQVKEEIELIEKEAEQKLEELEEITEEDFLAAEEEGALPPEKQKPEKAPTVEKPEQKEDKKKEEPTPPEKKKKEKKKKAPSKKKKTKEMDEAAKQRLAELRKKRQEDSKAAAAAGMSLVDWYASQGLDAQGKLSIGEPPVTQPTEEDTVTPPPQTPEDLNLQQEVEAFKDEDEQTDEDEDIMTPDAAKMQSDLAASLGMTGTPTAPPVPPATPPQKPSDIEIPEGNVQEAVDKELADKFGGLTPQQQAAIDKMQSEGKDTTKEEAVAAQKAIEMRQSGELQRKRAEQFGIEPQGRHPETGLFHWTYKGETFTTETATKEEIRQKIGEIDAMRSKKAEAERQATILEIYQKNQLGDVETDPFAILDTIKGSDGERVPITYSALTKVYVETEDGTVFKGEGEVPGVSPSTASDEDLNKIINAFRSLKQAAAEKGYDINRMINGYIVTDKKGTEHKVPAEDIVTTKKGKGTEQRSLKDKAEQKATARQYHLSEAAEIDEIIADARITDKTNADIARERGIPLEKVNQLTMDIRRAQGTLADRATRVTDADKITANKLLRTEKTKKPNRMIERIAGKIKRMTDLGNDLALSVDDLVSAGHEALWNYITSFPKNWVQDFAQGKNLDKVVETKDDGTEITLKQKIKGGVNFAVKYGIQRAIYQHHAQRTGMTESAVRTAIKNGTFRSALNKLDDKVEGQAIGKGDDSKLSGGFTLSRGVDTMGLTPDEALRLPSLVEHPTPTARDTKEAKAQQAQQAEDTRRIKAQKEAPTLSKIGVKQTDKTPKELQSLSAKVETEVTNPKTGEKVIRKAPALMQDKGKGPVKQETAARKGTKPRVEKDGKVWNVMVMDGPTWKVESSWDNQADANNQLRNVLWETAGKKTKKPAAPKKPKVTEVTQSQKNYIKKLQDQLKKLNGKQTTEIPDVIPKADFNKIRDGLQTDIMKAKEKLPKKTEPETPKPKTKTVAPLKSDTKAVQKDGKWFVQLKDGSLIGQLKDNTQGFQLKEQAEAIIKSVREGRASWDKIKEARALGSTFKTPKKKAEPPKPKEPAKPTIDIGAPPVIPKPAPTVEQKPAPQKAAKPKLAPKAKEALDMLRDDASEVAEDPITGEPAKVTRRMLDIDIKNILDGVVRDWMQPDTIAAVKGAFELSTNSPKGYVLKKKAKPATTTKPKPKTKKKTAKPEPKDEVDLSTDPTAIPNLLNTKAPTQPLATEELRKDMLGKSKGDVKDLFKKPLSNEDGTAGILNDTVNALAARIRPAYEGFMRTVNLKHPWAVKGLEKVGRAFEGFYSVKATEQQRSLENAKTFKQLVGESFGNEETKKDYINVLLAAENMNRLKKMDPEYAAKIKPAATFLREYFDLNKQRLKDRGIDVDFKKRMLSQLMGDLETVTRTQNPEVEQMGKTDFDTYQQHIRKIRAIYNSEFIHLPVEVWKKQLETEWIKKAKKGNTLTRNYKKQLKMLIGVKRRAISFEDLLRKGAIDEDMINPFHIIVNYGNLMGNDMAFADIRDAAMEAGVVKTQKSKPKSVDGNDWVEVGDELAGLKYFGKKTWMRADVKNTLDINRESVEGTHGFVKAYDSVSAKTKMLQFFNPFFLPIYDGVQFLQTGLWYRNNPIGTFKEFRAAVNDVRNKTPEYWDAQYRHLSSKPFPEPWNIMQAAADKFMRQKGTHEGLTWAAFEALDIAKQTLTEGKNFSVSRPLEVVMPFMQASWNSAWTMDTMVRQFTYRMMIKDGATKEEAANAASSFHGKYASVPARTRKMLNRVFFTPTFKIAMIGQQIAMVRDLAIASKKMLTGKTSDITYQQKANAWGAVSTASMLFAFDAMMQGLGFDRDEWGRKYTKIVDAGKGQEELVIGWSNPANLMTKFLFRITNAFDDPETAPLKKLLQQFSYEAQPIFRIGWNAINNKTPEGAKIHSDFIDEPEKWLAKATFVLKNVFALAKEFSPNPASPSTVRTKKYMQEKLGPLSSRLLSAFVFSYLRQIPEQRMSYRIKSITKEFNKEMQNGYWTGEISFDDSEEIEKRQRNLLRIIEALREETKKK